MAMVLLACLCSPDHLASSTPLESWDFSLETSVLIVRLRRAICTAISSCRLQALAAAGNDDDAVAVDGNLAGGKARRARSSLAQVWLMRGRCGMNACSRRSNWESGGRATVRAAAILRRNWDVPFSSSHRIGLLPPVGPSWHSSREALAPGGWGPMIWGPIEAAPLAPSKAGP